MVRIDAKGRETRAFGSFGKSTLPMHRRAPDLVHKTELKAVRQRIVDAGSLVTEFEALREVATRESLPRPRFMVTFGSAFMANQEKGRSADARAEFEAQLRARNDEIVRLTVDSLRKTDAPAAPPRRALAGEPMRRQKPTVLVFSYGRGETERGVETRQSPGNRA